MRYVSALIVVSFAISSVGSVAGEEPQWTKELKDRDKRGTLESAAQQVRGDTGKWNDKPQLQHAPPIARKTAKSSLDDWADQLLEKDFQLSDKDDNWLIFRGMQLDDNDRIWVERIERRGNELTVVVYQSIWRGRYRKNFTFYQAIGVNLGKLEPGKYEANWILKPLTHTKFEGDGRPRGNWPKDERLTDAKPTMLQLTFTVVKSVR